MKELQEAAYYLAAWLALAVAAAPVVAAAWLLHRRYYRGLWPPQRQRLVPWTGAEIGAVLLIWISAPSFFGMALEALGFYQWLYGPDFPAAPKPGSAESVRWGVWAQTLASPFLLAALPILLRLASETRLYQLGFSGHRWAGNVVIGCGAWLLLTPAVQGVHVLALIATRLAGRKPDEHELVRVIQSQGTPVDWALVVLVAVVLAPLLEELLFRGILQPWLARRSWGGLAATLAAFVLALPQADKQGLALPVFLIALTPGLFYAEWLAWRWLPVSNGAPAIYGTSLLFAMSHGGVWPSPVPLFVLSLGLGYVAYRTQGLVAPIVIHALFNGVTIATLLFFQGGEPTKGKETTSAERRPAAVSTSSIVPGSWLPRRT